MEAVRNYFPWVYVFTKTKINLFYSRMCNDKFIFPNYSNEVLAKIWERQVKAKKMFIENPKVNPMALVVWDDCLGEEVLYNQILNNYYFTSRHAMAMNIMTAQHVQGTPPAIRTNTDYAVLFNTDYGNSVEEEWRDFACKMDKKMFAQMLQVCSEDHGFLFVDNDPNLPYDQKFYRGRAEIIDYEFVVGCEEYWRGADKQLQQIFSGKMAEAMKLTADLNDMDSTLTKKMAGKFVPVDPKTNPGLVMGIY